MATACATVVSSRDQICLDVRLPADNEVRFFKSFSSILITGSWSTRLYAIPRDRETPAGFVLDVDIFGTAQADIAVWLYVHF